MVLFQCEQYSSADELQVQPDEQRQTGQSLQPRPEAAILQHEAKPPRRQGLLPRRYKNLLFRQQPPKEVRRLLQHFDFHGELSPRQ